jgi:hypothetical protein
LKNQIGAETFSLKVRNSRRDTAAESLFEEADGNDLVLMSGGDAEPGMRIGIDEQSDELTQIGVGPINEQDDPGMTGTIGVEPVPELLDLRDPYNMVDQGY